MTFITNFTIHYDKIIRVLRFPLWMYVKGCFGKNSRVKNHPYEKYDQRPPMDCGRYLHEANEVDPQSKGYG